MIEYTEFHPVFTNYALYNPAYHQSMPSTLVAAAVATMIRRNSDGIPNSTLVDQIVSLGHPRAYEAFQYLAKKIVDADEFRRCPLLTAAMQDLWIICKDKIDAIPAEDVSEELDSIREFQEEADDDE